MRARPACQMTKEPAAEAAPAHTRRPCPCTWVSPQARPPTVRACSAPSRFGVECPGDTFGRQALPMSLGLCGGKHVERSSGSFESMVQNTAAGLVSNGAIRASQGRASQADAAVQAVSLNKVLSTDPPYYDNIGYADLSDFFYVWLRRSLKPLLPDLFLHAGRTQGRRAGRHALSARQQDRSGAVLPGWHDQGHAPAFRTGASRVPRHDLLRVQAVRDDRWCGHGQHWLGDVSASRHQGWFRDHWNLAGAHGARRTESAINRRTRSPPASSSSVDRVLPTPKRLPADSSSLHFGRSCQGPCRSADEQHRPGGPRPGRHRPRHGHVHALCPGPRSRRLADVGAVGACRDQPDPGRDARETGRRSGSGYTVLRRLVRTVRHDGNEPTAKPKSCSTPRTRRSMVCGARA